MNVRQLHWKRPRRAALLFLLMLLTAGMTESLAQTFTITATANPTEGGTVTGAGTYAEGATCTLTATANEDYVFVNWTENGEEVSNEASYSFTVTGNRNMVANFRYIRYAIFAAVRPAGSGTVSANSSSSSSCMFSCDFEDGLQNWTTIDANGDGYNWMHSHDYTHSNLDNEGHNGSFGFAVSESYVNGGVGAVTPDNYLVSPQLTFSDGSQITFWATDGNDAWSAEHFGVAVSTTGNADANDFTTISEWTLLSRGNQIGGQRQLSNGIWYEYTVDLSDYAGYTGYVAIRHFNCYDQWLLCVDDIAIQAVPLGSYLEDETCTLTATPNENWVFYRWEENGEEVSTDAEYSFTVTSNRALTARFKNPNTIDFADPNVEAICVNNWDTDGDGFLSYEEAAAVTNLGNVFQGNQAITSFDELQYFTGLTQINGYEFWQCNNLASVAIPTGVTYIGEGAFGYNSLTSLNYYATNCSVSSYWLYECYSLSNLTIGDNVQVIPDNFVSGQSNLVGDLVIPNAVNSIGEYAFYNCSGFTGDLVIPNSVTSISNHAFDDCSGFTGSLTIGNSVTTIGEYAFYNCSGFTGSLTMSESLITIGFSAFNGCSGLSGELIIPNSVINLMSEAFSGCSGFTGNLTIPSSVEQIRYRVFKDCTGLTSLTYNAVELVNNECWQYWSYYSYNHWLVGCNSLTTLIIGENVETIYPNTFRDCTSITTLYYNAINCNLFEGEYSYYDNYHWLAGCSSLTNLNLGENVINIPDYAFVNGSFSGNLVFPESVLFIGNQSFAGCSGFTGELPLPNSLTSIGYQSFQGCSGFTGQLVVPNLVTEIGDGAFSDCAGFESLVIPNSVTYIGGSAFSGCTGFEGLVIPNSVTYIGGSAFSGCTGLAGDLVIPNSVTYLGGYAFNGCTGLNGELTIGSAVEFIGEYAFDNTGFSTMNYNAANCELGYYYPYGNTDWRPAFHNFPLTTLNFGEGVESLSFRAFRDLTTLTGTLTLPNSLTTIGEQAFYNCYGLEGIVMGNSVETIGNEAFRNCGGMRGELTLPETLLSVGTYAFAGCNEISVVNYNAVNCETMGNSSQNVFADCLSLTQIRIGANVESIPNYAFKPCFLVADMSVAATVPPTIGPSTFGTVSRSIPVHVPVGSGEAYRSAQYWEEFFNIVEDYSPSQYVCHWSANPNQFESNMTAIGVIQIEGVEQATDALELGAFCGDECRGSQLLAYYPEADRFLVFLTIYGAAGDPITFRLYDHEAEAESPLGCETHLAFEADGRLGTLAAPHPFNFTSIQVTTLPQGWTWWSGYVELEGNDGLGQMEESLGADGLTIKSRNDGFVSNYDGTWYGSLAAVNNESTYLIQTAAPCVMTVAGDMAEAASHPITLPEGWSWIGFPHSMAVGIGTALSGLEAENDDMLKSQESFSVYDADYGWVGTLHTLAPGMGLMYQSHDADAKTFTYALANRTETLEANRTARDNHWVPNHAAYSGNMSVIAVVELDGAEIAEGDYEIAAFAGGECRGSVKLEQVEATGRHTAFLTVFGEEVESLSFALYDAETGMEVECSDDNAAFSLNAVVGSLREPVVIRFRGVTGLGEWAQAVNVYPNPVGRGQQVRLGLGAETTGKVQVEIINAMGVVVESRRASLLQEVTAPSVAGIYTLRITAESGDVCYKKLVVR